MPQLGISATRTFSHNWLQRKAIAALARVADRNHGCLSLAGCRIFTDAGGKVNRVLLGKSLSGKVYLRGYWQSLPYFSDYAAELRKSIRFEPCRRRRVHANEVCVHIRSFAEAKAHALQPLGRDYYQAAYARCCARLGNPRFVVYADNLDWAQSRELLPATYELGEWTHTSGCPEHDLCALMTMSRFRNFVIANSSFSWWAAFLSDLKPWVQAPARLRRAWWCEEPLPAEWDEI